MVLTGIDRIDEPEVSRILDGKRIGLITGSSGISSDYRQTIDIMNEKFNVAAVYAPEHGPRGVLGPGERVGDGVDVLTGIPVRSLFEDFTFSTDENKKSEAFSPRNISDIDLMVFDMQDAGSRYFTYVSSLFFCMKACGKSGIPIVVFDRPNPIGGDVEGPLNSPEYSSFIGLTRVPIRHGMTVGELARMYNGEYSLGCDLTVIELSGWKRSMFFDDTGLPFVKPSPNLPTLDSLVIYNGTCMLAGTNVSEGRGTTSPFTQIGAPYINPILLADRLNNANLPGLAFSPAFFQPMFSKYSGEVCGGVNIHITDKRAVMPVMTGAALIYTIREIYPNEFAFRQPAGGRYHIDLSCGNSDIREGKLSLPDLLRKWQCEADSFVPLYNKYGIYQ